MNEANIAELFQKGVDQFNAGEYFEAHESWEVIWLTAPEPDKTFLQGITQVSAAFFHFSRGNRRGMESLLRKGLQKLERFPDDFRGLQLERLRKELRKWRRAVEKGTCDANAPRPSIEWQK
jgi:hypothetical protein